MPEDAPSPAETLTGRASRAFGWSFLNTLVSRLGTLAIGIALARVLGPEQFGVFAIAVVVQVAFLSFNELGVSLAIIRWRDDPAKIAPTVNTIAVASSAFLAALAAVGAPWIAGALGDVQATPVVQVMAVTILLDGLFATPVAILQREFMQKQRTIADQVNSWLGAGISLVLALLGFGAMSLAIGRLVGSIASGVLILRWCPTPYRFGWDRSIATRLFRFGLPLALASIVVFASGYADQMIVGSALGAHALGFYVLAFNLASWPVSIFSQPLRAVAPAAFSALQHDKVRMSRNFLRVLTVLSCVAVPSCLAVSGAAAPVVGFVYGSEWAPAADVLIWLAALAVLRIWFELAYDYLVVLGRSGIVLLLQASWLAAGLPAMLFAVGRFGVAGVAAAQLLAALVVALPMYAWSLHRAGIQLLGALRAIIIPVAVGGLVWLASWLLAASLSVPILAAGTAAVVAVGAVAGLAFWQRDELRQLRAAASSRGAAA